MTLPPEPVPGPAPAPEPLPPFAPAYAPATAPVVWTVVWHSRAVLIVVAAFALVALVTIAVASQGFPGAAPVEQFYAFGLVIDLLAVVVTLIIVTAVEYARRRNAARLNAPLNRKLSIFAIVALALSAIAFVAWAAGGGLEQLILLGAGERTRYMYHTGSLVFAGIPWALGMVFGALGFRPGANRTTNILSVIAIMLGALLAVIAALATIVYGLGLSD